jgi:hypothetical protein
MKERLVKALWDWCDAFFWKDDDHIIIEDTGAYFLGTTMGGRVQLYEDQEHGHEECIIRLPMRFHIRLTWMHYTY